MSRFISFFSGLLMAIAVTAVPVSAMAADGAPLPPYQMSNANTVTLAVAWDPATVDKWLPAGLVAVDGHTGGINVYATTDGYGLTPYSAAYAYVSVKGYNSPDGTPARYIIQGYYGPNPQVSEALRTHFGAAVTAGRSSQLGNDQRWEGIGTANGKEVIRIAVKPKGGDCVHIAGSLNYVGVKDGHAGFALMRIPYVGDYCPGEALEVTLSGDAGDGKQALDQLKVAKLLAGGQLKNGIFSFAQ